MSEIKGFDALMAKIDAMSGEDFAVMQKQVVQKLAQATSKAAANLAPEDSGELRNSIHEDIREEPGVVIGISYTNSDHAAFNEFGTGPVGAASGNQNPNVSVSHSMGPWKIKRGDKEVMADYWVYFDEAKQSFFATRGMPARPFMYPAAQAVKGQSQKIMQQAARNFFKKYSKGG